MLSHTVWSTMWHHVWLSQEKLFATDLGHTILIFAMKCHVIQWFKWFNGQEIRFWPIYHFECLKLVKWFQLDPSALHILQPWQYSPMCSVSQMMVKEDLSLGPTWPCTPSPSPYLGKRSLTCWLYRFFLKEMACSLIKLETSSAVSLEEADYFIKK